MYRVQIRVPQRFITHVGSTFTERDLAVNILAKESDVLSRSLERAGIPADIQDAAAFAIRGHELDASDLGDTWARISALQSARGQQTPVLLYVYPKDFEDKAAAVALYSGLARAKTTERLERKRKRNPEPKLEPEPESPTPRSPRSPRAEAPDVPLSAPPPPRPPPRPPPPPHYPSIYRGVRLIKSATAKSGYKGVLKERGREKWVARYTPPRPRKAVQLVTADSAVEAAYVYAVFVAAIEGPEDDDEALLEELFFSMAN